MSFRQDLIVIDYETTGPSVEAGYEPLELGAVRLDGETLEERAAFESFIAPRRPDHMTEMAAEVHGLDAHHLARTAPEAGDVVKNFEQALYTNEERHQETFHRAAYLASWNVSFDMAFHRMLLDRADLDTTRHGYHHFDLWTQAMQMEAAGLLDRPREGRTGLDATLKALGQTVRQGEHQALEDVRLEADCLRALHRRTREIAPEVDTPSSPGPEL